MQEAKIILEKFRTTQRRSLWRLIVDKGQVKELYLIELPNYQRAVDYLVDVLKALGHEVEIEKEERHEAGV